MIMDGYLPLDRGLIDSTLWTNGDSDTVRLWVYLLFVKDISTGLITVPIPTLAKRNNLTIERVEEILAIFAEPDPYSRSQEFEGRRIKRTEGGIIVLNHYKYRVRNYKSTDRARAFYERNPELRHRERGNTGQHGATSGNAGQRKATTKTETKTETKLKNLPDSSESVSSQIQELEHRYSLELDLIHETRNSCALSRKNGTMTDSVWLRVLQKLDKHPIESVLSACVTFCEKHADGEKDERYLLGIVKGETKKRGVTRSGRRMEKPQEVLDAERILRTATQSMLVNGERERCEAIIDNYNKRKDQ